MSNFYIYRLGGWWLAVDAVSHQDAAEYVKRNAPGASYIGKGMNMAPKTATGCTTIRRQEEIIRNNQH